jgi:disulfide bond formation protein DsbB
MIATTKRFTHGPTFWILLLILAVTLECVGLYYQYVLNYGPCVLCIHVRMLVFALMLVAIALLFLHRFAVARILGLLTVSGIFIWLTERSWQLLATERGWVMGSCDMLSGLPVWVPLERWLPFLFEIKERCFVDTGACPARYCYERAFAEKISSAPRTARGATGPRSGLARMPAGPTVTALCAPIFAL